VVVGAAVFFFVISLVGDSLLSYLVDRHPAWFIALNARNRNLVLAKPYLDWWTFFGIGLVRLLVSDPLFFLLGRWYGDAGVRWIERRSPTYGPMARAAERWFGKAAYPLVAIAPNNYVCLFAGAGGMSLPAFFALNIGGTIVRLVLLWYASEVVEAPLDWLREVITENRLPVLILSVTIVGVTLWLDQRSGGTEVGGLLHIDEEIEEEEAEEAAAEAAGGSGVHPSDDGADVGDGRRAEGDPLR
jgi:membrane protein DedA with SNARE-associated domain